MLNAAIIQSTAVNAGRRYFPFLPDDFFFASFSIETAPSFLLYHAPGCNLCLSRQTVNAPANVDYSSLPVVTFSATAKHNP